jgi:hypothetical protein
MAVYYVSTSTGSNVNNGTSSATPWATLTFALGAASGTNPGLVGGDIVWVAPGNYNEAVTIGFTSPSSMIFIKGDPTNSQGFPNVNAGRVYWNNNSSTVLTITSKNNIEISDFYFERISYPSNLSVNATSCSTINLKRNIFIGSVQLNSNAGVALSALVEKCFFITNAASYNVALSGANHISPYNLLSTVRDCTFIHGGSGSALVNVYIGQGNSNGVRIYNNTFFPVSNVHVQTGSTQTSTPSYVYNNLFMGGTFGCFFSNVSGTIIEDYNRLIAGSRVNVAVGSNSASGGSIGVDFGSARLHGFGLNDFIGSVQNGPNIGFGFTDSGNAPVDDFYGQIWAGRPDAGSVRISNLTNFTAATPTYAPAERNISILNIAPGTTSYSAALYLGSSGLGYSSTGLKAFYNRNGGTATTITLVNQTPSGSWVSGGFCEMDPVNTPGMYRLDVPNAALATGTKIASLVVRGASGTNGAFANISLSNVQASLDTTQNLGSTTVGDALNSANSGGVGKWSISGDLLYLYAADGSLTKKLRVKNLRIDV